MDCSIRRLESTGKGMEVSVDINELERRNCGLKSIIEWGRMDSQNGIQGSMVWESQA
jgi:ribosomal protein S7